MKIPAAKWA